MFISSSFKHPQLNNQQNLNNEWKFAKRALANKNINNGINSSADKLNFYIVI